MHVIFISANKGVELLQVDDFYNYNSPSDFLKIFMLQIQKKIALFNL